MAMAYEGVLLFAVVFSSGYLFDTLTESRHGLMYREARLLWLFLAIGLYFIICWWRGGQTLPMRAWHIRLINDQGYSPALSQLLMRYVLLWPLPLAGMALIHTLVIVSGWPAFYLFAVGAPFLLFIPTWFTPDGQFLHDKLSKTRLIDVRRIEKEAAPQKK